jgi:hypothetical protein
MTRNQTSFATNICDKEALDYQRMPTMMFNWSPAAMRRTPRKPDLAPKPPLPLAIMFAPRRSKRKVSLPVVQFLSPGDEADDDEKPRRKP